jgi:signal transduction histidine kinase
MGPDRLAARYREIQEYVGWTSVDAANVRAAAPVIRPHLQDLVADFYDAIFECPGTARVLTGGEAQVERLRRTLTAWLDELISGRYDQAYVERRWRVGLRHVEIGLDQVYTNLALARLRSSIGRILTANEQGRLTAPHEAMISLNKLIDMDLALIEDAYQTEHIQRSQAAERLATLGQVAGGVAHELRNPLNVVKTSVYYLRNARQPTPEKREEHLQRIERHVDLADRVITALSNFAKMPTPVVTPVDIREALFDALEGHPPSATVRVKVEVDGSVPRVLADPDQLRIVLGNLIRNACDAMPNGGELRLEARELVADIELAVADEGTGIAPDVLSRIMEPLYSTKARGLGLGLAITRSILEKHGGGLSVSSTVGKGTTFLVRLPASTESPQDPT